MCAETQVLAVLQHHNRIIGLAKLASAFDDGLEYRSDIGRRRCDHAQNIGAAGLVRECLREVAGLRLNLVKQPYVLDGNRRLVGECRDQFDLLVGEWTRFGA